MNAGGFGLHAVSLFFLAHGKPQKLKKQRPQTTFAESKSKLCSLDPAQSRKRVYRRRVSFWDCLSLGAVLNFRGVNRSDFSASLHGIKHAGKFEIPTERQASKWRKFAHQFPPLTSSPLFHNAFVANTDKGTEDEGTRD